MHLLIEVTPNQLPADIRPANQLAANIPGLKPAPDGPRPERQAETASGQQLQKGKHAAVTGQQQLMMKGGGGQLLKHAATTARPHLKTMDLVLLEKLKVRKKEEKNAFGFVCFGGFVEEIFLLYFVYHFLVILLIKGTVAR